MYLCCVEGYVLLVTDYVILQQRFLRFRTCIQWPSVDLRDQVHNKMSMFELGQRSPPSVMPVSELFHTTISLYCFILDTGELILLVMHRAVRMPLYVLMRFTRTLIGWVGPDNDCISRSNKNSRGSVLQLTTRRIGNAHTHPRLMLISTENYDHSHCLKYMLTAIVLQRKLPLAWSSIWLKTSADVLYAGFYWQFVCVYYLLAH